MYKISESPRRSHEGLPHGCCLQTYNSATSNPFWHVLFSRAQEHEWIMMAAMNIGAMFEGSRPGGIIRRAGGITMGEKMLHANIDGGGCREGAVPREANLTPAHAARAPSGHAQHLHPAPHYMPQDKLLLQPKGLPCIPGTSTAPTIHSRNPQAWSSCWHIHTLLNLIPVLNHPLAPASHS